MKRETDQRYDEFELQAYVDGELSPEEAAAFEERLAENAEQAAAVEAYFEQNRLIREAADAMTPAMTVDLRTARLERQLAQRLAAQSRSWRLPPWLRQAAAAVVLLGAGWIAHGQYAALDDQPPGYVAEAVGAHRFFADDAFRPVEFSAEASEAALEWAVAKLDRPIAIPTLDPLGLMLVGSRLHGSAEGPFAQFVYEDVEGNRLSLIVAPHPPHLPAYDFTLARFDGTAVGYWSDDILDYALVAETNQTQIEAIAAEITGTDMR
jgi:anti-sigma factor RsiW